jgi:hypothetical protein
MQEVENDLITQKNEILSQKSYKANSDTNKLHQHFGCPTHIVVFNYFYFHKLLPMSMCEHQTVSVVPSVCAS